jgi:hypothetical protein
MTKLCKLILDTDIDMDVDDAGALALCHSLADLGEMELLGVICDSASSPAAACVHVINASRNRPEIPVGTMYSSALAEKLDYEKLRQAIPRRGNAFYNQAIADMDPVASSRPVWNSTKLYRKLLSEAADNSVVICCIGFLTAAADLLKSEPDEWSSLCGKELVARKVKKLVSMAEANSDVGYDVCNWMIDLESADAVLHRWPTELVITPLGRNVWTGQTLSDCLPENDPVRRAYEIYMCGPNIPQQSWDLIAVYYAVRGCENLFQERRGKHCYLHASNGLYHWAAPSLHCSEQILLDQIADDKTVESVIEGLLNPRAAEPDGSREIIANIFNG